MDRITVTASNTVTVLDVGAAKTVLDPLNRGAEADVVATHGKEFRIKARDSQRFCTLVRMKGAEGWVEFTVTSKAGGTVVKRIGMQRRPSANGLSPRAGMMSRADLWPSNPGGRE